MSTIAGFILNENGAIPGSKPSKVPESDPKKRRKRFCKKEGCITKIANDHGGCYCSVHQRYYARTRVRKTKEHAC